MELTQHTNEETPAQKSHDGGDYWKWVALLFIGLFVLAQFF